MNGNLPEAERLHNLAFELEEPSDFKTNAQMSDAADVGVDAPIIDEVMRPKSDFTTEYLELSDDDEINTEYDIGGIDTLGISEEVADIDEILPEGNGLLRNPWDGLPYSSQYYELLNKRQQLVIWQAKDDFVLAMDESPIVLVTGKAGSGKSTQIPQWCAHFAKEMNFEFGTVVCTQPSSLAAMSLAIQVAREMDLTSIGNEVGYKLPFSEATSHETILKFCTDEILLREMAEDPLLERYSIVIVDEVQERTVSTDVLLTLLRMIAVRRDTLKIVIISLPHEMPKLEEFFDGVPVVDLPFLEENNGAVGSIQDESTPQRESKKKRNSEFKEVSYKKSGANNEDCRPKVQYKMINSLQSDYVSEAVEIVSRVHCDQSIPGDILVFMPGVQEINEVSEKVVRDIAMKVLRGQAGDISVSILHRQLSYGAQQMVYETHQGTSTTIDNNLRTRKVIICDSLAESSFSLGNISAVVDSGRERLNTYNCRIRARSDFLLFVSKVSADLRADRCRRDGIVYRLYTEADYKGFNQVCAPAITRCELSTDVLLMKRLLQRLGATFSSCQMLDPPAPESYMQALEDLDYHGALDENGELSDLGTVMSEFPLSLRLAKSVIASCGELCTEEMLTIASMLVVPSCYAADTGSSPRKDSSRRKLAHPAGDHFTLLNIYDAFVLHKDSESWCKENSFNYTSLKLATKVRSDLVSVMVRLELPSCSRISNQEQMESSVKKALLAGYFMQIAKDVDGCGNYLLVRDRHVARLSPSSTVKGNPEWVMFNEFILSDNSYIVTASQIDVEMVAEITPASYLANLPPGEMKETLMDATRRIRDTGEEADISSDAVGEQDASNSYHSEREVRGDFASKSGLGHHSRDRGYNAHESGSSARPSSSTSGSKTYRYSGYRVAQDTMDNRNSEGYERTNTEDEGIDILTQTARDLTYAYQQASSYVRNYNYQEQPDQACVIQ